MDFAQLLSEKKDQILAVTVSYGVNNVRVFGSVGRGQADKKKMSISIQ